MGIVGSRSHPSLIEAMIKAVEEKTGEKIECVNIHSKDAEFLNQTIERDRGIRITNETCHIFTPQMTRAERRKSQRKSIKKRK